VVFMGSPDFALPTLRRLASNYSVVGVVTQPDRPAGRGQQLTPPPVKTLAQQLGLDVIQPERLRRPESFAQLAAWAPELIVVTAFGQILRQNVLDLPRLGIINVHASLLPRWRGAAPIQAALLHGDAVSGASIMKLDAGVDTGPILARREVQILPEDTTASLSPRLAEAGAELLIEILPDYLAGNLVLAAQDETQATYAAMIQKEEGRLDFNLASQTLVNLVRAFYPWPGAFLLWQDLPLKVHQAHVQSGPDAQSGTRAVLDRFPAVHAADSWLVLDLIQPAGKKPMSGRDFLAGARGWQTV